MLTEVEILTVSLIGLYELLGLYEPARPFSRG